MNELTDVAQRREQGKDTKDAIAPNWFDDFFWSGQSNKSDTTTNNRVVPRTTAPWRAAPPKETKGKHRPQTNQKEAGSPSSADAPLPELCEIMPVDTSFIPRFPLHHSNNGGLSIGLPPFRYDREEAKQLRLASDKLVNPVSPAVVSIETDKGFGTGFIVDKSGYIVTADNLLNHANLIKVTTCNGDSYKATIRTRDERHHIALIKTDLPPRNVEAAKFGDSTLVEEGQAIRARGYGSKEFANTYSGTIESLRSGDRLYAKDIPSNATMMGAPLTNRSGEFIGMMAGSLGTTSISTSSLRIAEMLNQTQPSKFDLSYRTGGWAGTHLDVISNTPLVGAVDATLLGTGAYALRRATLANPGLTALGVGPLAAGLITADSARLFDAKSDPQLIRSGLALAADCVIGTSAYLMLKDKKLAFGVAAAGLLGRLATEFYPTQPQLKVRD